MWRLLVARKRNCVVVTSGLFGVPPLGQSLDPPASFDQLPPDGVASNVPQGFGEQVGNGEGSGIHVVLIAVCLVN